MSCSLSVMEAKLPPGFRFHPRDDELICDYLMKKLTLHCSSGYTPLLIEVDLNKCEPWDIPEIACVGGKEWYFYSQRDRKYATGLRTNRATVSGYWKATGKDRPVVRKGSLVGMRKTLVFYQGRAPKGRKTNWVMHEFRLEGPFGPPPKTASSKEDWVLCRVFNKNREVSVAGAVAAAIAKPSSMESNSYEESGSSSLPGLMDSYIAFDQNTSYYHHHQQQQQSNMNNPNPTETAYQQVPCFSIFSPINNIADQTNPTPPPLPPPPATNTAPTNYLELQEPNHNMTSDHDHKITPIYGHATASTVDHAGGGMDLNPLSCDKHVIKAVLSHLTKMNNNNQEGCSPNNIKISSPSFGEAASSAESYLSDVALPTVSMWSNNYM